MDMKEDDAQETPRPYRQTARAEAAEETARRIALAFGNLLHERWFEDVTLDEVASRAGVTVRTILRRFGGKEGLLGSYIDYIGPEIAEVRTAPPGDVEGAVARIIDLYETLGDGVIRNLAQELRFAALRPPIERGRQEHRKITEASYARWLEGLNTKERRRMIDALVVATDVYTWKLVRRDMGRSRAETEAVMLGLVTAILDRSKKPARQRGGKK
jgi:AcrR family transcriptional regulator